MAAMWLTGDDATNGPARGATGARGIEAEVGFRFAGLAVLLVASLVPWVSSRRVGGEGQLRLVDLHGARWAVALLALTVLTTAVLEWRSDVGSELLAMVGIGASAVITVASVLVASLLELLGIWLSPDHLPRTVRRLAGGVNPMPGVWLTAVAGALCLLGATGHASRVWAVAGDLVAEVRERSRGAYATVILLVALPLLVFGRYASGIEVTSPAGDISIAAWSVPWYGIWTLITLGAVAGLAVLSHVRPTAGVGVALAILGWVISLPAGLLVAVGSASPTLTAPGWMQDRVAEVAAGADAATTRLPSVVPRPALPERLEISFATGRGAVAIYLVGLLVMVAGWLVCRAEADAG